MPARKKPRKKQRQPRRKKKQSMQGEGPIGDWFKRTFTKKNLQKANKFLRKNKVISRTAGILDEFGVPYAGRVKRVSGNLGYGRRRKRTTRKSIKV